MDDGNNSKRTGRDRTADYRARLNASREPPLYVVANAFMLAVLEAMTTGEGPVDAAVIIRRAAARVVVDARGYSQEGFDNVLARVAQPGNRRRRLA